MLRSALWPTPADSFGRAGPISLVLPDVGTHPLLSLDTPLPPPPDPSGDLNESLCTTFTRDILPFFDFLSPARLNQLVRRHRELPASLTDDQLAFLYAIYAMGYLRQVTYATSADPERVPVAGEALLPMDPSVQRLDVTYFRHAIELVKLPSTVTALQALIILQLYCMAAASLATTRQVVGKLCYCVQELGLLHPVSESARSFVIPKTCSADVFVTNAGDGGSVPCGEWHCRPRILRHLHRCLLGGLDRRVALPDRLRPRALRQRGWERWYRCAGHGRTHPARGGSSRRREEHPVAALRSDLCAIARSTPALVPAAVWIADERLQYNDGILCDETVRAPIGETACVPRLKLTCADLDSYHFLRLLIRAPSAADPTLGISSLAILARSATLLLQHYERIFLTTHYVNCAWTVFARIIGAGHVVLQAVWRGEMIRLEAADLMGKVLWFLDKLETRWTETAAVARKNFLTLMDALRACRFHLADGGLGS